MVGTPTWQAAVSGQPPLATHINQLIGAHSAINLYVGNLTAAQVTAGATVTSTNGLYLAQSFATAASQTQVGYVQIPLVANNGLGANLVTTSVGLFANSAGAPTGSALVASIVTAEYSFGVTGGVTTVFITVPLPASGLTPSTTYWIVVNAAGNGTFNYNWHRSNQVSGASTSANGTTWSAQAYGFEYRVFDQTAFDTEVATWEDGGARWTVTTYTGANMINTYAEYTTGQTATGYLQSYRTFTYSGAYLTGVS